MGTKTKKNLNQEIFENFRPFPVIYGLFCYFGTLTVKGLTRILYQIAIRLKIFHGIPSINKPEKEHTAVTTFDAKKFPLDRQFPTDVAGFHYFFKY